MRKTIDIGLIQNKDTDFIVYDETDRTIIDNLIDLDKITSIQLQFDSPSINNPKIYKFDDTKKAYVIPYSTFIPTDFSQYNASASLSLVVDGEQCSALITTNMTSVEDIVDELNNQLSDYNILFVDNGDVVKAISTTSGNNVYIQVLESSLLQYICWNIGIYRGNDYDWGNIDLLQKDFNFIISAKDFGYSTEIPETYWEVQYTIFYTGTVDRLTTYINNFIEFSYKQTEIYYAKIFEYIARNFREFQTIEQRYQTDMEILMQKNIYFSSIYKAFLASIEIGDVENANELLNYIISFKLLNPIL